MFFPRLYIVSNCSFFFFYLVSYICLFLFVCECAVYELLAIKYNYTLNPLDFFFIFSNHTRSIIMHILAEEKKKVWL